MGVGEVVVSRSRVWGFAMALVGVLLVLGVVWPGFPLRSVPAPSLLALGVGLLLVDRALSRWG